MEMTTITALAKEQHVSYQSIWKMVTKYEKELAGHVVVKNRVRYLDADAVAFILEKRRDHPMVAMNDDQAAIIESQQQEIERLKNKVEALLGEPFLCVFWQFKHLLLLSGTPTYKSGYLNPS